MSATVVQIPISGTQIRDAEQAVVGRLLARAPYANSTAVTRYTRGVGPVAVELSSGAQLRLDPPAAPMDRAVERADRINQVTLAYVAN